MQGYCMGNTSSVAVPANQREERAVVEGIRVLDKSIGELAMLLTELENRLDVARAHLPHPEIVEEKIQSGSELSGMIAAKTGIIGGLAYRMKNLLDELEI